ncbi:MAG: hypothetical protein ACRYF3_17085 [Janthinobacterium lividum]
MLSTTVIGGEDTTDAAGNDRRAGSLNRQAYQATRVLDVNVNIGTDSGAGVDAVDGDQFQTRQPQQFVSEVV